MSRGQKWGHLLDQSKILTNRISHLQLQWGSGHSYPTLSETPRLPPLWEGLERGSGSVKKLPSWGRSIWSRVCGGLIVVSGLGTYGSGEGTGDR